MTRSTSLLSVAALAASSLLVACGGDDGDPHVVTNDAAMGSGSADAPVSGGCLAESSYSSPTLADPFAVDYPADTDAKHNITYFGSLNADSVPDDLVIDLWQGYGVFADGDIKTGEFALSGDETDYGACGACVLIAADDGQDAVGQWYIAQSGSLSLTSVAGNLVGTLTNVTFASADTDPDSGWPADGTNGACQSALTSASFDVALETAGGTLVGSQNHIRLKLGRRHSH